VASVSTTHADPVAGTIYQAGDVVTYLFTVTNPGNVTLQTVAITDALPGVVLQPACSTLGPLAPNAPAVTCTGTYTVLQADINRGYLTNTAVATGEDSSGNTVTDDDVVTTPTNPYPGLTVTKTANVTTVSTPQQITYTVNVRNSGNQTISNLVVTDALQGAVAEAKCADLGSLAPGESTSCQVTYQVTQADIDAGSPIHNVAVAKGTDENDRPVINTGDVDVDVAQNPDITLEKSVSETTGVSEDDELIYSFLVTNTGNVSLSNVTIDEGAFTGTGTAPQIDADTCDVVAGSATIAANGDVVLAPGGAIRCFSTPYTVTEQDVLNYFSTVDATTGLGGTLLSNTATANATSPAGPVSDTDDATTALNGPAPSAPAGPTPTTPQPTQPTQPGATTPATSKPPLVITGGGPYAPTGGTVLTAQHNLMAIPITAGFFGLLGLLWFGLSRNRRQERAS